MRGTALARESTAVRKVAEQVAAGASAARLRRDAFDILATGDETMRRRWIETLGDEDYVLLRRGTNTTAENRAYGESGFILSDAAREKYLELSFGGGQVYIAEVLRHANEEHQRWLDHFGGDLSAYAEAHALRGTELSKEVGLSRTLISTTDDADEFGRYFTPGKGAAYLGIFRREDVIVQTLETSGEGEYLVVSGTELMKAFAR